MILTCFGTTTSAQWCYADQYDVSHLVKVPPSTKANPSKVISIYLETDRFTRNALGSDAATESWLRDQYLAMARLYGNEGISTALTGMFWPANNAQDWSSNLINNPGELLQRFGELRQDTPDGRLKHFISRRGRQAGIAWLGVLESNYFTFRDNNGVLNHAGPYAISLGLTDPDYWNPAVLAHEMGHNLGSRHTHACAWGTGNQVLDRCASPECGGNPGLSANAQNNTIMSYCGSVSELTNGFGTEPGNLIRSRVTNARRDLSDGHCPIILYLASDVSGTYDVSGEVIVHPGFESENVTILIGCE
ncbi:MAG: M12 family metallo-peptidase [Bacteroidota bacterium]